MANRIQLPTIPRPTVPVDLARVRASARDAARWRPPAGDERRALLFRLAWSPFWVWSDVPTPRRREHEAAFPPGGMVGDYVATELTRLTRRIWLQQAITILARALWLPLLLGCVWLGIELSGGPELRFVAIGALWLVTIPLALVFATVIRPSRRRVARMLDRSFALQERMVTAVDGIGRDVPAEGERPAIAYLQMADAANVISDLKEHPAFRLRPPVREIVLGMVCILTMCALFFLQGLGGGIPALAVDPVPAFVPAAERLARQPEPEAQAGVVQADAPTREEVQEMAKRSSQSQQDLKRLGDALSDQAVTRAAAEAIERGDYAAAAELIRQMAENADQLSPAAREGLADDLERAADEMSPGENGLAEATQNAAEGLREGGDAANQGMSELGDAVDRAASEIVSQEELASQMSRAEAAEASEQGDQQGGGESTDDPGQNGDAAQEPGNESNAGEPQDESGSGGDSSSSASQPGDDDSSGEPGDQSEPGERGGDQSPGGAGAQSPQEGGESQPGGTGESPAESANAPGSEGQTPGENASNAGQPGQQGPDDGSGDQGGGAGSGDSPNLESPDSGNGSTGGEAGSGTPSEPNVEEGGNAIGEQEAAAEDPRTAITLSRSPEEAGVQTGGQGNSASVGSGNGASVGNGTTVQGEVGAAGPDSNHVPSEYRGLVEDFFSDQDDS